MTEETITPEQTETLEKLFGADYLPIKSVILFTHFL